MRAIAIVTLGSLLVAGSSFAAREPAALRVSCPEKAPAPSGICLPYDRQHCRFADGTLLRDDAGDPRAPYFLKPVAGRDNVYCLYDSALRQAGVTTVQPLTLKGR
jgi:hypothetical protein